MTEEEEDDDDDGRKFIGPKIVIAAINDNKYNGKDSNGIGNDDDDDDGRSSDKNRCRRGTWSCR